ncbi:hypothetical protein QBC37DRAFT_178654 [Rhypophila decipiens]|uniref:F-box domain-containing protein n=1 Tax=Rhypophila decipiens TaxID=261697 RepID=A0AAN6YJB0_9PEZI|nr:hypothetical protein QBC37DRAFT_178654 [Rhypophila decipiens]
MMSATHPSTPYSNTSSIISSPLPTSVTSDEESPRSVSDFSGIISDKTNKMPSILIPEITLLIAEKCEDYETILSLALTCKAIYSLLFVSHQKALVKAWIKRDVRTGRLSMLTPLNWSGTILDTIGTAVRGTITCEDFLPRFSFWVMRELDARRRRIDALFDYQYEYEDGDLSLLQGVIRRIWQTGRLTKQEMGQFVAGLKRACVFVDTMADCAVGMYIEDQHQDQGREEGGWVGENKMYKQEEEEEEARLKERKVHWSMLRSILSAADSGLTGELDLTYLYVLVHLILPEVLWRNQELLKRRPGFAAGTGDTRAYMVLAMQEVFLRYGSVALEGWFLKRHDDSFSGDGLSAWLVDMTELVMGEIKDYEKGWATHTEVEEDDDGTGVLPGLSSALYHAAEELFLGETSTRTADRTGVDTGSASIPGHDGVLDDSTAVRDQHMMQIVKIFSYVGT